jgi:hypothetical protein
LQLFQKKVVDFYENLIFLIKIEELVGVELNVINVIVVFAEAEEYNTYIRRKEEKFIFVTHSASGSWIGRTHFISHSSSDHHP